MAKFLINSGITIDHTNDGWDEFKKWINGTYASLKYTWIDEGLAYNIIAIDNIIYRMFSINKSDATEFESKYKKVNSTFVNFSDSEGRLRISQEPRKEGDSVVIVSHNWCDPTTWYAQSIRINSEQLTETDGYSFGSSKTNWIDLTHGKLYREDLISSSYLPKIYIDGNLATERTPFSESGGDFEIDYKNGLVNFFESQSGKTITADFNYENGSCFYVRPTSGKKLWIEKSEVQFSSDIDLKSTVHFQAWAYNPYDLPNKIPVSSKTTYKNARDFIDEAQGVYPSIPAFGGPIRGTCGHFVFPFNYLQLKELLYSYGLEIRVWLENDIPFEGTFSTATFYCTSLKE